MAGNKDIHAALAAREVQFVELTHAQAREFGSQMNDTDKATELDLAVAQAQDESAASGFDAYVVLKIAGRR